MENFLIGSAVCGALILVCTAIFYEIVAHTWVLLPRLKGVRIRILFTIFATFLGHTLTVWIFGFTNYLLDTWFHFGTLVGEADLHFIDYVYFSGVSYSSLGFGNVDAVGGLRLITVAESVLGLIFIGWTVTFTYAVTEKYLYHRRGPER